MTSRTTSRHCNKAAALRLLFLLLAVLGASTALAAEQRLIPFQAQLTNGAGADLTDVYNITFAIYDEPTGGTDLWSEIHPSVSVIEGRVNVLLGSLRNLDDPDGNGDTSDAVQFDQPRFVGIKIGAETNQEMVPRHQLVPAFHSRTSDALAVGYPTGYSNAYNVDNIVPLGTIVPYFGNPATLPENWKVCDGSTVSDPESPLHQVRIPDLRGKFLRGEEESAYDPLGSTPRAGGSDSISFVDHTHQLVSNGMHEHTGTTTDSGRHGHAGNVSVAIKLDPHSGVTNGHLNAGVFANAVAGDASIGGNPHTHDVNGSGEHTHPFLTDSGGVHDHGGLTGSSGNQTFDNRPAYLALHYIIRIK